MLLHQSSWRSIVLVSVVANAITIATNSPTYSFQFTEDNVGNILLPYSISVRIDVTFLEGNGSAQFRTTILDITPFHFSMFVNGRNCGIISQICDFNIPPNEDLNIDLYKIDMQSRLITFKYPGKMQNPEIQILGCDEKLNQTDYCVSSEQYNIDTRQVKYRDRICMCKSSIATCSQNIYKDPCISATPWWNNNLNATTSTTFPSTTIPKSSTRMVTTTVTEATRTKSATTRISTTSPTTPHLNTSSQPSTTKSTTLQTSKPTTVYRSSTNTFSSTFTTPPVDTFPTLKNLSDATIGINNVSQILGETLVYSEKRAELDSTQVSEIAKILYNSANVKGLRAQYSESILQNLDNILYVNETTMFKSGSSVLTLMDMLPNMVHNTEDERVEYLEGTNLGFSSKRIDCLRNKSDDGILDLGTKFELLNTTTPTSTKNSIVVPLSDLCESQEITHVYFTIYRSGSLFVGDQKYRSYDASKKTISRRYDVQSESAENSSVEQLSSPSLCSQQISVPSTPVMSATLLNNGVKIREAADTTMAILRFNTSHLSPPLHGSMKVTWWDVGRSQWSTNRHCQIVSHANGVLEAECAHLTDFAIIVDAALNDPNVCDAALIGIGYFVNGTSIASLFFLTFFSISSYITSLSLTRWYQFCRGSSLVRRDFLALCYHCILLLFYVMFTIFANQDVSGNMCTTIAAIMYALLLSSLFLTVFQAIRNITTFSSPKYYQILDVILSVPTIVIVSIVIPFTISIILLVFTTFFNRQDCFCWVRPDFVIYAIILPVSLLLISTFICTVFIIYKVFFGMKRKFSQSGHHYYDPYVRTKIVAIIVMQISLGLPWVLQFGTLYSPYTTFWHYTFTIVMGSQGTILLLIFIYKRYKLEKSESDSSRNLSRSYNERESSIRYRKTSLIVSEGTLHEY